jgi:serine/threonine protein kinase
MSKNDLTVLLHRLQNQPEFDKLLRLFEEKFRSYGSFGKVEISNPTESQIKSFRGLMGLKVRVQNNVMTVRATVFEQAIQRAGYAVDLKSLLEAYFQKQLITKRTFKEKKEEQKEQFFQFFMNHSNLGDSFHTFISFVKNYRNAPFIHIMYKNNPDLLLELLEFINKLFDHLTLSSNTFLPMLAYELTADFHALNPKSDKGNMMQFALQVLNYLKKPTEIISKPNEEEFRVILKGHGVIFCPDANRKMNCLWVIDRKNEEENNYQLIPLKKIGEGAFAEVYRIFDPILKKELACKVLLRKPIVQENEVNDYLRFKREVRFLKEKVSHRNIIEVNKIQLFNDPAFFTMPLADSSLEKWLELNPSLAEDVRITIFKDILNGVSYLHECKISHRDLAPHNILLVKESEGNIAIKVADFGLAKDKRSLSVSTGLFVNGYGRVGYTAPEQMQSLKNADHLSDIYSLGALLYYLLSGKSPEERYRSTVKYQLIVGKAMEEERSKRYQTVRELLDDINLMYRKSQITEKYPFYSLKKYEFGDFYNDVNFVLNCISSVQIETPNEVLEKFINPFILIPIDVFAYCVKNETVMIPFMYMIEKNIWSAMDIHELDWDQITLLIESVYIDSKNLGLQLSALNIILAIALKLNNLMAQSILVGILASMESYTEISAQVTFIIRKSYFSWFELLITILKDIDYPLDIRDLLNDY